MRPVSGAVQQTQTPLGRIETPSNDPSSQRSTPLSFDRSASESLGLSHRSSLISVATQGGSSFSASVCSNDFPPPHSFIDGLTQKLELSVMQASDLHEMVSLGVTFESGELLFSLTEQAHTFKTHNLLYSVLNQGKNVASTMTELKTQIGTDWKMSSIQKEDLLSIIKDLLYDPKHTCYQGAGARVKSLLQKKKDLGFADAFSKGNCVRVMVKEISTRCQNIRNQIRNHIKLFTFGAKQLSLDEFCCKMSKKYLLQKLGKYTTEHKIRFALLCRFACENPDLLNLAEKKDETADPGDVESEMEDDLELEEPDIELEAVGTERSGNKCQQTDSATQAASASGTKQSGKGKGKDWWGRVDAWLQKLHKKWGDQTNQGWQNYIEETLSIKKSMENGTDKFLSIQSLLGSTRGGCGSTDAACTEPIPGKGVASTFDPALLTQEGATSDSNFRCLDMDGTHGSQLSQVSPPPPSQPRFPNNGTGAVHPPCLESLSRSLSSTLSNTSNPVDFPVTPNERYVTPMIHSSASLKTPAYPIQIGTQSLSENGSLSYYIHDAHLRADHSTMSLNGSTQRGVYNMLATGTGMHNDFQRFNNGHLTGGREGYYLPSAAGARHTMPLHPLLNNVNIGVHFNPITGTIRQPMPGIVDWAGHFGYETQTGHKGA